MIGRICEAFQCLPSQAVRELQEDPEGLALRIIAMRDFAQAKEIYDNAKSYKDLPDDPLVRLVEEFDFAELEDEDDDPDESP